MEYSADNLHIPGLTDTTSSVFARVSAGQAGWQHLNMVGLELPTGQTFGITIDQYEYVAIILGGVCDIRTSRGDFLEVGRRPDVFTGLPYAIYMPRETEFEIESLSEDFAMASCWVPTDQDHPIKLIQPHDVHVAVVGGGNASYQINTLVQPDFGSHRITVREMYTPGGNWSTFPPHKHDTDTPDTEASYEELIFHKLDRPGGFALQRVYTADGEVDATMTVRHNDIVLVPRGYHTMSSAHGYTTYTLNVTAGTSNTLLNSEDPRYTWVRESWFNKDPRLPVVDHGMEPLPETE